MAQGFFVTGTDTEVGKTWASLALMHRLQATGARVIGMKPVASGCERRGGQLINPDARLLQSHSSLQLPYEHINPYAFEPPIAPHLAAAEAGRPIDLARIEAAHERLLRLGCLTVIEGIGGWLVPLTELHTVADLALRLAQPVVLVIALRLGCLNHALLSVQSIQQHGAVLAGWIAVPFPGTARSRENLEALHQRLPAPCLGVLPWLPKLDVDHLARHLTLPGAPAEQKS